MKKLLLILFILVNSILSFGQETDKVKRKFRIPLWTYHSENVDVFGLSVGLIPDALIKAKGTSRTFGARFEVDPLSIFYFMFGKNADLSSDFESYKAFLSKRNIVDKVYGLNISTGSPTVIDNYGISLNVIMQNSRKSNGISITGFINTTERANGIFISGAGNGSYVSNGLMIGGIGNDTHILNGIQIGINNGVSTKGYGVQIGLFNTAKNFKGLQLGLWNKNDKRSLPIINWNF